MATPSHRKGVMGWPAGWRGGDGPGSAGRVRHHLAVPAL